MSKEYDFKAIEKKWQERWLKEKVFRADDKSKKPKFYQLETFPYPSAEGLHVGHPKGYIAEDIHARHMRMKGYEVLYTMGWDAFGLPTENYAIKVGQAPKEVAESNITNFKRQVQMFGLSYDWEREINTSSPEYYKWTQWLFTQLFKKGLAYRKKALVNWCPSCKTVLANEQVKQKEQRANGKLQSAVNVCERCGTEVEQKEMEQWFLKITDYAERLLEDLKGLDWPGATIKRQEDWIGRSEGALLKFEVRNVQTDRSSNNSPAGGDRTTPTFIEVFTTRPDTLFGATYLVLSPEHEFIANRSAGGGSSFGGKSQIANWEEVEKYVEAAKNKKELDRITETKNKTGIELKGIKAINPGNKEEISIWVADYVLASYGTGAIMAVPAHDERDFEFAKKFNLPIRQVVCPVFGLENRRKDAVHRNTISAIIRNKEGKILILKWKEFDWVTPIIGGIEENEAVGDAAIREALEETGFKTRAVRVLDIGIESHFYADHKKEWRSRLDYPVLLELIEDVPRAVADEEKAKHEYMWVEPNKAIELVTFKNSKLVLEMLLLNKSAYVGGFDVEADLLINSDKFNGMDSEEAKWKIAEFVGGERKVQYKIRDWSVGRQRYWGVPIPLVFCENCAEQIAKRKSQSANKSFNKGELENPGWVAVSNEELPVELPELKDYRPKGTPPLGSSEKFWKVECPKCGGEARRETETLDTFVDSSWYYLRYTDSKNEKAIFDKKKVNHWMPVDLYIIGAEHTVLHLLYARFITKFLYNEGYVKFQEPFLKLRHVGLIQGADGQKMSKSRGNVVNPDDLVAKVGVDAVRVYEMFMGPFEQGQPWDSQGVLGAERFLARVWRLMQNVKISARGGSAFGGKNQNDSVKLKNSEKFDRLMHQTIKKIGEDIESLNFNTAISALMILLNEMEQQNQVSLRRKSSGGQAGVRCQDFVKLLYPFAPHLAEEIWHEVLGKKTYLHEEKWPEYDVKLIQGDTFVLVVQINGRARDNFEVAIGIDEAAAKELALKSGKVKKFLGDAKIKKIIFVKDKLINFVI